MRGRVADATGNARGARDAVDKSSPGLGTWLLVMRDVRRMLASRDGLQGRVAVEGGLGNFEGRSILAWGTCTRRRVDQLLGPSCWNGGVRGIGKRCGGFLRA